MEDERAIPPAESETTPSGEPWTEESQEIAGPPVAGPPETIPADAPPIVAEPPALDSEPLAIPAETHIAAPEPVQAPDEPVQPLAPPAADLPAPPPAPRQPPRPPEPARVQRSLRPPTLVVWSYLSRPEHLRKWLGETELELAVGGEFTLRAWNGDVVRGQVTKADPPSVLALTWRANGMGHESRVTIRLEGDGPGTRLTVRHEGLTSEPERRQSRRLWREILTALRTALHEERDAHDWGASLPIAVRAPLARNASDIWPLLSTAHGLEKWLAHVDRFDGTPDGQFRFTSRYQGREVVEEGTIELLAPESRIVLAWEWAGEAWGARTKVELSLEPDPSGSALLLLHSGFDRLAPEKAAVARREYASAWPEVVADLRRLVAPVPV
jgi:uncharacterized protein YndB with AHSA1/START domain